MRVTEPDRPPCRVCGGAPAETLVAREMTYGTRATFPYDLCGTCGTLQIRAIPADLSVHYPADYYSFEPPPRPASARARRLTLARDRAAVFGAGVWARWLIRHLPPHRVLAPLGRLGLSGRERILDVGSGAGAYLRDLGDLGFDAVVGVDPHLPNDLVHDNGVRVLARELDAVDGTFDLVTFHHAFEHVRDPRAALAAAAARLAPEGRCVLRVPTVSSDAFATYRENWVQLDAPRHLHLFSRAALHRLAADVGLEVDLEFDDSTAFQFWGSEQLVDDVAVLEPASHAVDPEGSRFTPADIAAMERRAEGLNARCRGDQTVLVLARPRP